MTNIIAGRKLPVRWHSIGDILARINEMRCICISSATSQPGSDLIPPFPDRESITCPVRNVAQLYFAVVEETAINVGRAIERGVTQRLFAVASGPCRTHYSCVICGFPLIWICATQLEIIITNCITGALINVDMHFAEFKFPGLSITKADTINVVGIRCSQCRTSAPEEVTFVLSLMRFSILDCSELNSAKGKISTCQDRPFLVWGIPIVEPGGKTFFVPS